jgi:hypothetical protein
VSSDIRSDSNSDNSVFVLALQKGDMLAPNGRDSACLLLVRLIVDSAWEIKALMHSPHSSYIQTPWVHLSFLVGLKRRLISIPLGVGCGGAPHPFRGVDRLALGAARERSRSLSAQALKAAIGPDAPASFTDDRVFPQAPFLGSCRAVGTAAYSCGIRGVGLLPPA